MKKGLLFLLAVSFIFISGCVQQEVEISPSVPEEAQEEIEQTDIQEPLPTTANKGLGNLCTGEEECISFCLNNRGWCEEYCKGNTENELCLRVLPSESGSDETKSIEQQVQQSKNILDKDLSHGQCQGNGTIPFSAPPMKPEDILVIIPMGDMIGGHVTPIDHLYFYPIKSVSVNIYAPANGTIVYITAANKAVGTGETTPVTYTLFIEHTCDFYAILGLLDDLSPKIKENTGIINEQIHVRIPITQGEILGNIEENSLDYSVFYTMAPPKQWIFPEHYTELGKKFIIDPFDYYTEPVKSKLLEKNLRTIPPLGGKFDHDIDGTLSGSWFEENTNWYEGPTGVKGRFGPYWKTHVSFSPDPVDPSGFVISLGDFNGNAIEGRQFGAKGNAPKPKDVKVSSTPTIYELVGKGYVDPSGKPWSFGNAVHGLRIDLGPQVYGVVLVQLIDERKLKLEIFPGKTASQVSGFTNNAKFYER